MLRVHFEPFDKWPQESTPAYNRTRPFTCGYGQTLKLLEKELRFLDATEAVIQLNVNVSQIRMDGMPRSGAQPNHPGVILSFQSKHGPLQYSCDACVTWEDNLRAIALTLERLRMASLYGVAKRGEQYTGWKALPAPAEIFKNQDEAMTWLKRYTGFSILADAVKAALVKAHPDHNGQPEDFERVQAARAMLGV